MAGNEENPDNRWNIIGEGWKLNFIPKTSIIY